MVFKFYFVPPSLFFDTILHDIEHKNWIKTKKMWKGIFQ